MSTLNLRRIGLNRDPLDSALSTDHPDWKDPGTEHYDDPESLLLRFEEQDEEDDVPHGTHLNLYYQGLSHHA